ncbi:MAG: DUF87 domain-containing protein [Candidatus Brocadiales bacterium]|nr:DUF87 domain-containing protein [Candidatus Brocadiales bacterium]
MRNEKENLIPHDLQRNISILEGRALETFSPTFPEMGNLGAMFYHVLEIGKENETPHERKPATLSNPVEEVILGLFGANASLAYLVTGEPTKVNVYYGCSSGDSCLPGILVASFPYISLEGPVRSDEFLPKLGSLPYCGLLTGIPGKKAMTAYIDRLIRGLYGQRWCYLVTARPLITSHIEKAIETLNLEERRFASAYLREGTSEKSNNPAAKYYQELLQCQKERYKKGRYQGMFDVEVCIFCASQETLDRSKAILYSIFAGRDSKPQPLRFHQCLPPNTHQRERIIPTALNTSELCLYIQPPEEEHPGFSVSKRSRFKVALPYQKHEEQVTVGRILDRGLDTGNWLEIPVRNLTKHGFITGTTGSGKTTSCLHFLGQLWEKYRIPWLIIEPKEEYRNFLSSEFGKDARVFTLGNETVSPFRFNPFEVPTGVGVQSHISYLRSLFLSSFVLYPPMPYVLEVAIQQVYEDKGWDTTKNVNLRGEGQRSFPTLTDLCYKVDELAGKLGYDEEVTMNVRAGLKARIQSLRVGAKGKMLDTRQSIPVEELLAKPTILELGSLVGDPEEIAFVMGALLITIFEHRKVQGSYSVNLRHLTILEEAHHLLTKVQGGDGLENSNIRCKAIETFCTMLAEIRSYGEGLLIADQIPNKLAIDVLKNTNLKIIHRLVAKDDREAVGECMNMSDDQKKRLSTLETGQAVVFGEGMEGPFLVAVPAKTKQQSLTNQTANHQVREHMKRCFFNSYPDILLKFGHCKGCLFSGQDGFSCNMVQKLTDNNEFNISFNKLFLGAVKKEGVIDAFVELLQKIESQTNISEVQETLPYLYCVSVHSLEKSVESKGRLFNWTYSEIELLSDKFMSIVRALSHSVDVDIGENLKVSIHELVEEFSTKYLGCCQGKKGPFSGCSYCQDQCLYRYEAGELFRSSKMLRSWDDIAYSIIHNKEAHECADFVLKETACIAPLPESESHLNLSLCYLTQFMSLVGVPFWRQGAFLETTKVHLADMRKNIQD